MPELLSIKRTFGDIEENSYAFTQRISGDINVQYVLLLSSHLVQSVAARILQEDVGVVDAAVFDVISEFVNVVVGSTCTKFSMRHYRVSAGPPQVMDRDAFLASLTPDPIVVRARVPDGEFHLAYLIDPGILTTRFLNVEIETAGELTRGETVVDVYGVTGRKPNADVSFKLDLPEYKRMIINAVRKCDSRAE